MRLSELEKWGIPSRVIERWRERQGERLLPVQSKAIRKGLIGRPGETFNDRPTRLLVSAPTSSGKSFCAELAAVKALTAREKTIMAFPLKSLTEQKYELLEKTYGELGVKCLIVTGDHPENDSRFFDSDYQIAVVIYEKFDLLLTSSLDALKNIGLVVIDEIQTIGEPGRGAILERLLTKIKASEYTPSIVGLSAVIGDDSGSAGQLARWLDATLVEESTRPVELMRGVAAEGSYQYRMFNNGYDGSEPFVKQDSGEDSFGSFVRQIKSTEGSILIFLKSRMETVDAAFKLAASVNWPEATDALKELEGEEPSFLIRSLRQALGRGVAFHNSDLSPRQRHIVEQAFIDKHVKALFSTTTLAMGVNLSADTVYLETVKYSSGKYDRRPSLVSVSRAEFDNMSGRAGRLDIKGRADNPGRAVIMAENEFDRDILWQTYIAGQNPEPVKSVFDTMLLEDWLLDMIACGLIRGNGESLIETVFKQTFYFHTTKTHLPNNLTATLQVLVGEGLVLLDESTGEVKMTPFGQKATGSGLSVRQAIHFRNKLQQGYPESSPGWIALALSGPDWNMPPAVLSKREQVHSAPVKMLYRHFDHLIDEADYLVGARNLQQPLSYRQAASLKAFLLLERWRSLTPVQKLEEQFQMHLGQIMNLGETAGHLVAAIAELAGAIDSTVVSVRRLKDCAFSLRFGIPAELRPMYEEFGQLLSRHDFGVLKEAGVESLRDLCEMDDSALQSLISEPRKLQVINDKLEQLKEELEMQTKSSVVENHHTGVMPSVIARPETVEIDGGYERERYLVKINGFPVRLTGKSFKYFAKLAWSRVNRDSGWIYKEDIEMGFNQARYLYRMKGEISAGLNMSWPVIENNRLGYYRLNVDPSRIRINLDNLKNHPDYEVRSLVAANTGVVN